MKPIIPALSAVALLFLSLANLSAQVTSEIEPVASLPVVVNRLQSDFGRHRIYASAGNTNSIEIIDTDTLAITKTLAIGAAPVGMAISPDGTKLYVALSGTTKIGVIDLTSLTVLPSLTIAIKPWMIAAGLSDRLYVTPADTDGRLLQVDATTGATEVIIEYDPYSRGFLQISPDYSTLHFGNAGLSPSTLERFDVSTATPVLTERSAFNSTGSSGEDLKLSHNGQFLCYPSATGNSKKYATDLIDPTNYTHRFGNLDIGPFPSVLTFSPNDALAYEHQAFYQKIYLFDTTSFLQLAILDVPNDSISDLVTDSSGRYLFVADDNAIQVYDLMGDVTATLHANTGDAFSYQAPILIGVTSISATGLPTGLTFNPASRTISGIPTEDGTFPILITASDGVNTLTVNLTLVLYPKEHALNISTRLAVETGENVLIAGFIITGELDEQIVVRGIGPGLEVDQQPLTGRMEDPMLELYDSSGALIDSNDNWGTDPEAYVLGNLSLEPTDLHEPALYRVLSPGAYTVIIKGVNNTTGIALAEVYDVAAENGPGNSRLANISTRGNVQTGDNVMIGGVIVGGPDHAKMIIRAIGPSLSSQNVTGSLANPRLDLYNSQGTVIASNDNWKDTQQAEIEASGLAPTNDKESAISISLAPAAYTAIVSGVDAATGVALVEVYNLP